MRVLHAHDGGGLSFSPIAENEGNSLYKSGGNRLTHSQ